MGGQAADLLLKGIPWALAAAAGDVVEGALGCFLAADAGDVFCEVEAGVEVGGGSGGASNCSGYGGCGV